MDSGDRHNFYVPRPLRFLMSGAVLSHRRQLSILSWEFVLAIMVNMAIAVWFVTSSQASQDVKIESQNIRIGQNERLLEVAIEQRIAAARLEQKVLDIQKDINEIKTLLTLPSQM